jgi:hypothetical protein
MKVYGFLDERILDPLSADRFHLVCFEYEKDNFTITPNINEADIIPIVYTTDQNQIQNNINFLKENNVRPDQILVILHIFHAGDGDPGDPEIRGCSPYDNAGYKTVYVTTDYRKPIDSIKSIFYDHMFNATKAMYELNEITNKTLVKKFLIPNKTYEDGFFTDAGLVEKDITERSRFRKYLKSTILESDCYFSAPDNWIYLNSQEMSEVILNDFHYCNAGMGFHPLANNYYETSAVSVYVESCVETLPNIKIVTEKSLNPFVKGHFILPFSYQYYVRDMQELYGFKLPDWIDYSYDNISDDNERFLGFMKSFGKIRFKSLQELQELCNRDIDILKYNRNIFFERNYDNLYNKLKNSINILNGN